MASNTIWQAQRDRWLLSAGWVAGTGITLVEMQWGMEYVFARLANPVSAVVGWLPMIQTVVWHLWGAVGC
jgi:hypothetical protein